MSLHSSLKRAEKMTAERSVMKRTERIKWLKEKGMWKDQDRVLGLAKIKVIKVKAVKKEKAKDETKPEGAAAAANTSDAAAQAKTAAPQAKTQAAKPGAK